METINFNSYQPMAKDQGTVASLRTVKDGIAMVEMHDTSCYGRHNTNYRTLYVPVRDAIRILVKHEPFYRGRVELQKYAQHWGAYVHPKHFQYPCEGY